MAFVDEVTVSCFGANNSNQFGLEGALSRIDFGVGQAAYMIEIASDMMDDPCVTFEARRSALKATIALLGQLGPAIDVLDEAIKKNMISAVPKDAGRVR